MEAAIAIGVAYYVLIGLTIGVALNAVLVASVLHRHILAAIWPAPAALATTLLVNWCLWKYIDLSIWNLLALLLALHLLFQFLSLRTLHSTARRIGVSVGLAVIPWASVVLFPLIVGIIHSANAAA